MIQDEKEWWHEAACKGMPLSMFFPEHGRNAFAAKKVCQTCPVSQQCLQDAIEHEEPWQRHGIFGGLSRQEREERFDGRPPRAPKRAQTVCPKGHALTEDNLLSFGRGRKKCKKCHVAAATRTHCVNGHELTPENTRNWSDGRRCLTCARMYSRASREKRAAREGRTIHPHGVKRTHCSKGHELTPENTYVNPTTNYRRCRKCHGAKKTQWIRNKRAAIKDAQSTDHDYQRQQVGKDHQ
ncbi:WhiB family transcriptional regulator [Mycobacterium intracellulare]|uniref:WhiB family transcriptional regulator n=1 Tax=Mycobacterium intracellulare TaxID=1767 RepID=UPI00192700EC